MLSIPPVTDPVLHVPRTLDEAVELLADPTLTPLAGGTWVMRTPLRDEAWSSGYVAVADLPELRVRTEAEGVLRLGAGLTHTRTAAATAAAADLRALHQAASSSANPAIRERATLGGNLCTTGFPAADLATALLCLDARATVVADRPLPPLPVADLLSAEPAGLVTGVEIPRTAALTGHARLPLRSAGDYPVAIVSVGLLLDDDRTVRDARIAVGSVRPRPWRWTELEQQLSGAPADPEIAKTLAVQHSSTVVGRDDADVPGWYRVRVLPTLVARAVAAALAPAITRSAA